MKAFFCIVAFAFTAFVWGVAGKGVESSIQYAPRQKPIEAAKQRVMMTPAQVQGGKTAGILHSDLKSVLNIERPLRHGGFLWNDSGVPDGTLWIRVDLSAQVISVFRGGHEIGTAIILYGADQKATPEGVYPVQAMLKDHQSSTYGAPMPYTLRLTDDGVSIHGAEVSAGAATHGCIGVPLEFARKLFEQVSRGDQVAIVRT